MEHLSDIPSLKYPLLVFSLIVLLVTSLRIYLRSVKRRFWWDDVFALTGAVCISLQTITLWIVFEHLPIYEKSQSTRVAVYYINSISLYVESWSARLAILYTIIRIQTIPWIRMVLHIVSFLFLTFFVINTVLLVGLCEGGDRRWHKDVPTVCPVSNAVPIFQISTSFLSDGLIIAVPIYTLQALVSYHHLRNRLIGIFSASVLITIGWTVQSIFLIADDHLPALVSGIVAGFIALVICNLTIAIPRILSWLGIQDGFESRAQIVTGVDQRGCLLLESVTISLPDPNSGEGEILGKVEKGWERWSLVKVWRSWSRSLDNIESDIERDDIETGRELINAHAHLPDSRVIRPHSNTSHTSNSDPNNSTDPSSSTSLSRDPRPKPEHWIGSFSHQTH